MLGARFAADCANDEQHLLFEFRKEECVALHARDDLHRATMQLHKPFGKRIFVV